jgi:hypothetical protein
LSVALKRDISAEVRMLCGLTLTLTRLRRRHTRDRRRETK